MEVGVLWKTKRLKFSIYLLKNLKIRMGINRAFISKLKAQVVAGLFWRFEW